jgi:hypothetical protein
MPYMRRDKYNGKLDAQPVYADAETEQMLAQAGFAKASGTPYYVRSSVEVVIYDDGTWEPNRSAGFLPAEWQTMREFAGVQLKDFIPWLEQNYQILESYTAKLKPEEYRKEEKFTFVKVYKDDASPLANEYVWFIQQFSLLGSDGVIPADKEAIPNQFWFVDGRYYKSRSAFVPTGIERQVYLSQTPDLQHEMTDSYTIQRIKDAFLKDQRSQ